MILSNLKKKHGLNLLLLWLDSLGHEYGEGCILNLETTWEESEPRTPLICILSIGSDPSAQIAALAKAKEIGTCT